jgi:fructuronate reductase
MIHRGAMTSPPLTRAALPGLPNAARPRVDPAALRPRVLHFGLGAFHRAHQAIYTERAAASAGQDWGIAAVAPRSADTAAALRGQDCLYTVTEHGTDGPSTFVVGSLVRALALGPDGDTVDALLADPSVTVVSLTITEKGYHRRPDGSLDVEDAGVAADLAAARAGSPTGTVLGRLAAGLAGRMRAGGAPVSVVSCDNMAGNGHAVHRVLEEFVAAAGLPDGPAVLDWLAASVRCPDTVVDRIVPVTTAADRDRVAGTLGVHDALPVTGETYRQWVLRDDFAADRPPWELDGALLVPDVAPYQLTKLRLLNGAHSALAYLGLAAGLETIADTMRTGWGPPLVRALAAEVGPTLPPGGPDPAGYAEQLVARFGNPGIRHLLRTVGTDGTQKIPQRWPDPLRALGHAPTLELALAGWVNATRPEAALFGAPDPLADRLRRCWTEHPGDAAASVRALLDVLGAPDLAGSDSLVSAILSRLPALRAGRVEL